MAAPIRLLFVVALMFFTRDAGAGVSAAKLVWHLGDTGEKFNAPVPTDEYSKLAKDTKPHLFYYEEIDGKEENLGELWLQRRLVSSLRDLEKFSHYRYIVLSHQEHTPRVGPVKLAMLEEAIHTLRLAAHSILEQNEYNLGFEFFNDDFASELVSADHPNLIDFPKIHAKSRENGHEVVGEKRGKVIEAGPKFPDSIGFHPW